MISAAYYLRVIKVMVFDKNGFESQEEESSKLVSPNEQEKFSANEMTEIQNAIFDRNIILQKSYNGEMSNSLSFSIAILTVLTVFFVLKPSLILNSAHIMALSLFYL